MINRGEDDSNPKASFSLESEEEDLKFIFQKENPLGEPITTTLNLTKLKNYISFRKVFEKAAFVGFLLGVYEIVSDCLSSSKFIVGDYYLKTVYNKSDPTVYNKSDPAVVPFCEQTTTTNTYDHKTGNNETSFTFSCFEQVMFKPGPFEIFSSLHCSIQ